MVWQAAAIAGGSQLLGGLLQKPKKVQWDFQERERLENERFKWLVKGAQKAGFNPLTVLRSSGGQMANVTPRQSPLGARAALGEAIKTFGGTYAQDAIQRATEDRAQEDWKERYDYRLENPLQPVRQTTRTTQNTETKDDGFLKEGESPYGGGANMPSMDHRVQVRLPTDDGVETVWVLKDVLDRYGITEGSMLTAGDMTEFQGELTGEAALALQADKVLENLFRQGIFSRGKKGGENFDPPINTNRKRGSGGL